MYLLLQNNFLKDSNFGKFFIEILFRKRLLEYAPF